MTEVGLFLAHAVALEEEAAERYAELADAMEVHNNKEVAELFRKLSHYSVLHLNDVRKRAEGIELPHLKPWEYQWANGEPPESAPSDNAHYMMTPYHCIHLALRNEKRGYGYYADLAYKSADPEVKRLAAAFAAEEAEHVKELEKWAATAKEPDPNWDMDLDPPGEVE